jgi:hypothetical protein
MEGVYRGDADGSKALYRQERRGIRFTVLFAIW